MVKTLPSQGNNPSSNLGRITKIKLKKKGVIDLNFNNQLEVRKEKINKATEALKNKLESLNYLNRLVYACVQGSTNYNLDVYNEYYESDVDWKVFILPTFRELYNGEKISKTFTYECGQFELKDIRLLPELLGKMNSSYLELLFGDYAVISDIYYNEVMNLRSLGNDLINERLPLLVKSLMGMCLEKQNALCHEYGGLKEKLAYFGGYDPKQLHHAIRLQYILQDIEKAVKNSELISYGDILKYEGERKNYLLDIKVNGAQFGLPEALDIMKECVENCRKVYQEFWSPTKPMIPCKTDLNNYVTPIFNTTLDKIKEIVYKIVEANFSVK